MNDKAIETSMTESEKRRGMIREGFRMAWGQVLTPNDSEEEESGSNLKGKYIHCCAEWDNLIIDETCPEWEACLCYKTESESAESAWVRAFEYANRHGWISEIDGIPPYAPPQTNKLKRGNS